MEIDLEVYATVICNCGKKLEATVTKEKGKIVIVVNSCENCMDAAAKFMKLIQGG